MGGCTTGEAHKIIKQYDSTECSETDAGLTIEDQFSEKGTTSAVISGKSKEKTGWCKFVPSKGETVLIEHACLEGLDNSSVLVKVVSDCGSDGKCEDGACVFDVCSTHGLMVTNVTNNNGNLQVSYNSLNVDGVNIVLSTPFGEEECPSTGGGCSGNSSGFWTGCTVTTDCSFPPPVGIPDTGVTVTDEACPKVSDTLAPLYQ